MGDGGANLERLRLLVDTDPLDVRARHALCMELLESGEVSAAKACFAQFDEDFRAAPAFLSLGLELATQSGDILQVARFRKALRDSGAHIAPGVDRHPSRMAVPRPSELMTVQRHLRVVRDDHGQTEPAVSITTPDRKLNELVGVATVKSVLADIIESARTSEASGGWLGGTLLYGPPGCGKHFSAQTVAGELGVELWTVNLAAAQPVPAIIEELKPVFDRNEPAVLLLEHLDTVPGHVDQHAGALLSSLVPLLDGARARGIVVLGAATLPWQASPLVVRPGRLGAALLVLPPDAPAREVFLSRRLADAPRVTPEELAWVVTHTEGYSFADLDVLLGIAREVAAQDPTLDPRDVSHLALRAARQQVSPTSAEWLSTAGHHALISEHGGLYDDLLNYFHAHEKH